MKKIIYTLAVCLVACVTACDDVDKLEDRYIPMPQVELNRKVLLEEFTGQRCVNCPTAHLMVSDLKRQYGENLIAVGIHATQAFGLPEALNPSLGLMNEEGDAYAAHWSATALPCGLIDRTSGIIDYDKWAAVVRTEMEKLPKLDMELTAEMDTLAAGQDSLINIKVQMNPNQNIAGKLQLWITESDIVAPQTSGSEYIMNYVHNHVFRSSVNGLWGTDVVLSANVFADETFTFKIKKHWNRKHLSVVAFVYNDTEGVLQAEECEVTFRNDNNN